MKRPVCSTGTQQLPPLHKACFRAPYAPGGVITAAGDERHGGGEQRRGEVEGAMMRVMCGMGRWIVEHYSVHSVLTTFLCLGSFSHIINFVNLTSEFETFLYAADDSRRRRVIVTRY